MKILSLSGFVPEQICDTVRFTGYSGERSISHYCGYAADYISQVLGDASVDGAVFPKSCDSARIIKSYLGNTDKFIFQLPVPARRDESAVNYFAGEIRAYKEAVKKHYGIEISDIAERTEAVNERNKEIEKLYENLEDISYSDYLRGIHKMLTMPLYEQTLSAPKAAKESGKRVYKTALRYEGQDNDPIYKWTEDILTDFDDKILEYKVYSVKQYGKAFIKSLTENRYEVNSEEYDLATGANGQTYFGKMKYSEEIGVESRYLSFRPLGIMDYYLRKTFDMCLDLGVDVILEVVPMNKATYDACYESFLTDYFDYMKGLQSEYPQITINGDLYYYDNEYFGDTNHLNPNGAEKYSNSIKEKYPDVFE